MKSRMWMNLVMAVLVSGLFFTVSCAKKAVVSDAIAIEAEAKAATEAERLKQQKIDEQMDKEKMIKDAVAQAESNFINKDILFAYDSSDLDATAVMLLKEKAAWLNANPSARAIIEGHCDDRGTTDYNLALGERRASVAKTYLINMGISASILETISYGEEQSTGSTEEAYRLDRRAHFVTKP